MHRRQESPVPVWIDVVNRAVYRTGLSRLRTDRVKHNMVGVSQKRTFCVLQRVE